jgi:hypothetical protein
MEFLTDTMARVEDYVETLMDRKRHKPSANELMREYYRLRNLHPPWRKVSITNNNSKHFQTHLILNLKWAVSLRTVNSVLVKSADVISMGSIPLKPEDQLIADEHIASLGQAPVMSSAGSLNAFAHEPEGKRKISPYHVR